MMGEKNYQEGFRRMKVEDHGNGFMIIAGKGRRMTPEKARKVIKDYVDNPEDYAFACPTHYNGRSACWMSDHPGNMWMGAKTPQGWPLS